MNNKHPAQEKKEYWLDKPRNVLIIIIALMVSCALLFFADAFYHKHPYFEIENLFGFYGVYGFFVCVALVVIAKALRTILMRPEDYYDVQEETHRSPSPTPDAHD